MDYIKIRFGDDLDDMGSRFEKTLEQMFRSVNPMFSLSERNWSPQMDIYETQDEIIVRAEIAGVDKENLQVEINSRAVQITGTRREQCLRLPLHRGTALLEPRPVAARELRVGEWRRVQLRFSAYNVLNHPLRFPDMSRNLTLKFAEGVRDDPNDDFGRQLDDNKSGRRIIQLAIGYSF